MNGEKDLQSGRIATVTNPSFSSFDLCYGLSVAHMLVSIPLTATPCRTTSFRLSLGICFRFRFSLRMGGFDIGRARSNDDGVTLHRVVADDNDTFGSADRWVSGGKCSVIKCRLANAVGTSSIEVPCGNFKVQRSERKTYVAAWMESRRTAAVAKVVESI